MVKAMAKIAKQLTELIGNTPLLELTNYEKENELEANLIVKLEYFNPLGSVKDRVAHAMIEQGIADGKINSDTVIIEPTSGNTGIGLAFVTAAKGLHLILTMPDTMSVERRKIVSALGAEIVLTPGRDGMKGAIKKAEELKELYERVASQYDPDGFRLYFAAQEIVGIKRLWEEYPYEDACGRFAEADGHELLKYLTAAYFEAVSWEIVPGTTYEKAILGKVDTSTPEYIAFEKRLYETVLERMGFREQLPRPSGRAQTDHATGKDNCKRGDAR